MAYSLATSYAGEALLSGFNFFDGADPTNGFVAYQNQANAEAMGLYSVDSTTGSVRLGVDDQNVYPLSSTGRPSIRLESKQAYNKGLFVADFLHMPPSQCGLWPAFWAYGPGWPNSGEIDIIEGASTTYNNLISAHTGAGCTVSQTLQQQAAGQLKTDNCFVGQNNVGCGYAAPESDTSSYGDGFNAAQGGVYAMEWDDDYIKIWHFSRSQIPTDITDKQPDPESWPQPDAIFGGSSCAVDKYFKNMNLVINIDFCGDWGNAIWGKSDSCGSYAPTCNEYVANNPQAFSNAYWDVRYIDAYQKNGAASVSSPAAVGNGSAFEKVGQAGADTTTTTIHTSATTTVTVGRYLNSTVPYRANVATVPFRAKVATSAAPAPPPAASSTDISTPTNKGKAGDGSYLGCFGSSTGFKTFQKVEDSPLMTLERCVVLCHGKTYAGVYGSQCLCANTLDADTRAATPDQGICDKVCPGDDVEFCGGNAKKIAPTANTTMSAASSSMPLPPSSANATASSMTGAGSMSTGSPAVKAKFNNNNNATADFKNTTGSPLSKRGLLPLRNMLRRHTGTRHLLRRLSNDLLLTVYLVDPDQTAKLPPPPPLAPPPSFSYPYAKKFAVVTSTAYRTVIPIKPSHTSHHHHDGDGKFIESHDATAAGKTVIATTIVTEDCGCDEDQATPTPPPPPPPPPPPVKNKYVTWTEQEDCSTSTSTNTSTTAERPPTPIETGQPIMSSMPVTADAGALVSQLRLGLVLGIVGVVAVLL